MNDLNDSLIVEAHLHGARIRGLLQGLSQNRRLIDILNNQDQSFELMMAEARLNNSDKAYRFKSVSVKKSDVLYAVPRETAEQLRRRAMYRTGMTTAAYKQVELGALLATCHIRGTASIPAGVSLNMLALGSLSHFFALSSAKVSTHDGQELDEPVVLVNRESVVALGRSDDTPSGLT